MKPKNSHTFIVLVLLGSLSYHQSCLKPPLFVTTYFLSRQSFTYTANWHTSRLRIRNPCIRVPLKSWWTYTPGTHNIPGLRIAGGKPFWTLYSLTWCWHVYNQTSYNGLEIFLRGGWKIVSTIIVAWTGILRLSLYFFCTRDIFPK